MLKLKRIAKVSAVTLLGVCFGTQCLAASVSATGTIKYKAKETAVTFYSGWLRCKEGVAHQTGCSRHTETLYYLYVPKKGTITSVTSSNNSFVNADKTCTISADYYDIYGVSDKQFTESEILSYIKQNCK